MGYGQECDWKRPLRDAGIIMSFILSRPGLLVTQVVALQLLQLQLLVALYACLCPLPYVCFSDNEEAMDSVFKEPYKL